MNGNARLMIEATTSVIDKLQSPPACLFVIARGRVIKLLVPGQWTLIGVFSLHGAANNRVGLMQLWCISD